MRGLAKIFFLGFCVSLLALFVTAPGFAADPVVRLKYATFMPPVHPIALLGEQWCKELAKRTNGRVKVTYFPGGTLVSANQTYDSVVKGNVDIGFSVVSYTPGRQPLCEALSLPLGYKSGVQATRIANAFIAKFKPKEFDDVKLFYLHTHGPGHFHCKTPVNTLADLKGKRFKGDGLTAKIITAAGGTPTTVPMLETYDAIKRGVADGAFVPSEALKNWKLSEVTHFTYSNSATAYANPFFIAMNKEKWNSLPKDIQQIIDTLNKEWIEKQGRIWDDLEDQGVEFAKKGGHKFTQATAAEEAEVRKRVKPLLDTYAKDMKAKGLPGDEVVKFIQDAIKTTPAK